MSPFYYLKRREIDGKKTRRNWRLFFLALIAGKRTIVLNATFKDGSLVLSSGGVSIVANTKFYYEDRETSVPAIVGD